LMSNMVRSYSCLYPAANLSLSMILSENRFPLFRIML